ncbi:hypothetical protein [Rhodococcus maanshanensis]|uniref:hypothetical protein n=1 Tax=Rhodococcus maanshanensis TaxID=183556 RepID=UPI000932FDC1|nr:hypothetical protein [Rhodococcus maanshanensis]
MFALGLLIGIAAPIAFQIVSRRSSLMQTLLFGEKSVRRPTIRRQVRHTDHRKPLSERWHVLALRPHLRAP